MEFNELKSNWNKSGGRNKTYDELLLMIRIQNHPKLSRIRLKLIVESALLLVFVFVYHNIFDGDQKPLWVNIVLIASAVLFIMADFAGYLSLQNIIRGSNIKSSVERLYRTLQRISLFSIIASFLFGTSVILFFTSATDFSGNNYLILAGMFISMLVFIYLSYRNWHSRINQLKAVEAEFEEKKE